MHIQRRTLVLAPFAFAGAALAQQQKQRYMSSTLYRVHSGKWADFRADAETTTPKLMKAFTDSGMPIAGWAVSQVLYPGFDSEAYNAVLGIGFDGPPRIAGDVQALYQKTLGISQAQYFDKMNSVRALLGRVLWRRIAWAPGKTRPVVNAVYFWKMHLGKADQVEARVREFMQPIGAQRVADGAATSFTAWRLAAPSGSEAPYDLMMVYGHADLESAVEPKGSQEEDFHKAHPGKSYGQFVTAGQDMMTLYRRSFNSIIASS